VTQTKTLIPFSLSTDAVIFLLNQAHCITLLLIHINTSDINIEFLNDYDQKASCYSYVALEFLNLF